MNWDQGSDRLRMEVEMVEYGVDVNVEPPPASTVIDETSNPEGAQPETRRGGTAQGALRWRSPRRAEA